MERDAPYGPAIFDAVLAPNRSLGRAGLRAVMAGAVVVSAGLCVHFALQGAWPVLGFFGLDVALLWLAFRLSTRSGRLRETVRVARDSVVVRRIAPGGNAAEWRFAPCWLRVSLEAPAARPGGIVLASHGASLTIGAFLAPEERESLVRALRAALAEANRAPGSEEARRGRATAGAGQAGPRTSAMA